MSRIILQPAGNPDGREHYNDTIENQVDLKYISKFLSPEEIEDLSNIYNNGKCSMWGVTSGGNNFTKWKKIEKGDVTLFSRDGAIYSSAVTTYKLINKELAADLWDYNAKGLTWENIYFVDEVRSHNIPYISFNKAAGYQENYVIQGFNVLDEEKSNSILEEFGLESSVYIQTINKENYSENVLPFLDKTEKEFVSKRRLEQGYLRKVLFKNKSTIECSCCGKNFPVSFVWCSHIKKRNFCSLDEKNDINVVTPMCKFGCDDLFEKGFISVNNEGKIVQIKEVQNDNIEKYINGIINNRVINFSEKNSKYFNWHYEYHK
jgi:hypothetical protein